MLDLDYVFNMAVFVFMITTLFAVLKKIFFELSD